ncbi:MAG: hypothetical protein PWQ10_431 [Patescibacteria group bacterium]|nr:hypothetical protein [Patescibacteria group bacterium]
MKKTIKTLLTGLLAVPVLALGVNLISPVVQPTFALTIQDGADSAKSDDQAASLDGNDGVFRTITNIALYVIGAISVLMLIYGGIRYTISGGDTAAVTAAKNTILYAIVGIVVALLAYAIVNFVITRLIPQ